MISFDNELLILFVVFHLFSHTIEHVDSIWFMGAMVVCYAPAEGALSDDVVLRLCDVCLSVTYIGPNKSRTERPRKTEIGTG